MKKNYLFLLLILLCCNACMQTYLVNRREKLVDFPTPRQSQAPEVYMPGEKPADTSYIKTHVIEVYGNQWDSFAQLLDVAKQRAQQYGVDAILVLDKKQQVSVTNTQSLLGSIIEIAAGTYDPHRYEVINTNSVLTAVGIKYLKNVNYLPNYARVKKIYAPEASGQQHIVSAWLNFDGMVRKVEPITPEGLSCYRDYVEKYDLNRLLNEESGEWTFMKNQQGQLVKRNCRKKDQPVEKCRFFYDAKGRLSAVRLSYPTYEYPYSQKMLLRYATENSSLPSEKLIYGQSKKLLYREVTEFLPDGKAAGSVFYRVEDGKETPLYYIRIEYHTQEYLQEMLRNQP